MKKVYFLASLLLCITSCTKNNDLYEGGVKGNESETFTDAIVNLATNENCVATESFNVPVTSGKVTVVTYGNDTLAVTDHAITIQVPKNSVSRAATDALKTVYVDYKDVLGYSEGSVMTADKELLMFEDSPECDYDYNDLVLQVAKKVISQHGKTYVSLAVKPIALGGQRMFSFGFSTSDGKDIIVADSVKKDFFSNPTTFVNVDDDVTYYKHELDEDGNYVTDKNGNLVYKKDENGNLIVDKVIKMSYNPVIPIKKYGYVPSSYSWDLSSRDVLGKDIDGKDVTRKAYVINHVTQSNDQIAGGYLLFDQIVIDGENATLKFFIKVPKYTTTKHYEMEEDGVTYVLENGNKKEKYTEVKYDWTDCNKFYVASYNTGSLTKYPYGISIPNVTDIIYPIRSKAIWTAMPNFVDWVNGSYGATWMTDGLRTDFVFMKGNYKTAFKNLNVIEAGSTPLKGTVMEDRYGIRGM